MYMNMKSPEMFLYWTLFSLQSDKKKRTEEAALKAKKEEEEAAEKARVEEAEGKLIGHHSTTNLYDIANKRIKPHW